MLGAVLEHSVREGARGAVLQRIDKGGPADRARLQPGDLIQAIDGNPIEDPCALERAILDRHPGDAVKLTYVRATQTFEEMA